MIKNYPYDMMASGSVPEGTAICERAQLRCFHSQQARKAILSQVLRPVASSRSVAVGAGAQAEVQARARAPGTAVWRLSEGRGSGDPKGAAGRLDFVLQARPRCAFCIGPSVSPSHGLDSMGLLSLRGREVI